MSPLRRRMIEDMQIRNLTVNTQRVYVAQVVHFACHFRPFPTGMRSADAAKSTPPTAWQRCPAGRATRRVRASSAG